MATSRSSRDLRRIPAFHALEACDLHSQAPVRPPGGWSDDYSSFNSVACDHIAAHVIALHDIALHGIAWHDMALHGIAAQDLSLHGIASECHAIVSTKRTSRFFGYASKCTHCMTLRYVALQVNATQHFGYARECYAKVGIFKQNHAKSGYALLDFASECHIQQRYAIVWIWHALHDIALHDIAHMTLQCMTLRYTTLHCMALYHVALHCMALHYVQSRTWLALHAFASPDIARERHAVFCICIACHWHSVTWHCVVWHCITLRCKRNVTQYFKCALLWIRKWTSRHTQ